MLLFLVRSSLPIPFLLLLRRNAPEEWIEGHLRIVEEDLLKVRMPRYFAIFP